MPSLVGSEMCIRDSLSFDTQGSAALHPGLYAFTCFAGSLSNTSHLCFWQTGCGAQARL